MKNARNVSPTADVKSLLSQTTKTSRVLPPEYGLVDFSYVHAFNENARIKVKNNALMTFFCKDTKKNRIFAKKQPYVRLLYNMTIKIK